MLTRRGFLAHAGAGILAATAGCRPQNIHWLLSQEEISSDINLSLAAKAQHLAKKKLFLGYPLNMNAPPDEFFTWRRQLVEAGIGSIAYNNVGNPFRHSHIPYNTHDFEREVILAFGKVFSFSPEKTWGFLSHSGTDSNMHGMYMGRTLLKGRTGVAPKAYFTNEAHYSVQILRDLLGLDSVVVETMPDGSMDPEDLGEKLADNPDRPALVVATVGTTFKGAIDPIDRIRQVLQGHSSYLHVDAALFGGYLAYTSHAADVLHQDKSNPAVERYDSIAVSCHKFFGFPAPAGLFVTTKNHFDEFSETFSQCHNPEYIHQVPGTITCSRDAVKPAEFYFFSTESAMERQAKDAHSVLQNAAYLLDQMQTHFSHLEPIRANNRSNIIYFRKPSSWIVEKYCLATMHLDRNEKKEDYAHVVVMPHVSQQVLTEFLTDLGKNPATAL